MRKFNQPESTVYQKEKDSISKANEAYSKRIDEIHQESDSFGGVKREVFELSMKTRESDRLLTCLAFQFGGSIPLLREVEMITDGHVINEGFAGISLSGFDSENRWTGSGYIKVDIEGLGNDSEWSDEALLQMKSWIQSTIAHLTDRKLMIELGLANRNRIRTTTRNEE